MKIYLNAVGCRLNQSEIERMAARFRSAGCEIVSAVQDADIAIVNTCTVTAKADADSRKMIRKLARLHEVNIIATGCYATVDPEALKILPAVKKVVSNDQKDQIVDIVLGKHHGLDKVNLIREPIPGSRKRTRAFIKIQDGCNNFCTFCITRIARGASVSRPAEEILDDIHCAVAGGVKEVVLTGVNLGSYGHDFLDASCSLVQLINAILKQTTVDRIRLSSLEPWDVDEQLIDLFSDFRMCRHIHLPLQSGSDVILKKMGRNINTTDYRKIIYLLRKAVPTIAITTDIIVGFPGETGELFSESMQFVDEMNFAGGHVFSFSPRPHTPAENFPNVVADDVKRVRSRGMRDLINKSAACYQEKFLGEHLMVLWERAKKTNNGWLFSGLSDNYLRVTSSYGVNLYNQISEVKIKGFNDHSLYGVLIDA